MMPDQVFDLLQDQVFLGDGEPNRKCFCNKAADIPVNTVPATRSYMGTGSFQRRIFCHIASGCPENVVQDHREVNDVTHHASNILLAGIRESESVADASRCLLTSLDTHRKPNRRTYLQVRSSQNYRQFNSLDNLYLWCETLTSMRLQPAGLDL